MSISKLRELGVMIDCSRNAVVKLSALKDFIRICSKLGYDYVGLYTEDTIEIPGEPYFGYQRGRYTIDEIRDADSYARELGMELRPYVQTLAHINQIVDYKDYIGSIDVNDILLIGDPGTEKLLDNLIKSVSEAYTSRKINIGMDEAHMVGLGKYLDENGYHNRVELILKHLEMVIGICKKYGMEPQMWSDMFFRLMSTGAYGSEDDESADELAEKMAKEIKIPEGLELVYWDYYSIDKTHYERILKQHKALTDNISFAGGAWRWLGLTPYNDYSIHATDAAITACMELDVDSVVMTMWGDDGTECSIFSVLPALYEAAKLGGKLPDGGSEPELIFKDITGYSFDEFMLLDIANPGCKGGKRNNLSKILLFNDPLLGIYDSLVPEKISEYYRDAAEKLFDVVSGEKRAYDVLFEMQGRLCKVLESKADLGIRLRKAYRNKDIDALTKIKDNELPRLIELLDRFYASFRKQWMQEAKSFGFEVQTIRIGGLKQRLTDIICVLNDYMSGLATVIEELETEGLPVGYCMHGVSDEEPEYNRYEKLATTSRLSW